MPGHHQQFGMSAAATFVLHCLEVDLYAESGADGQIVDCSFDVFVGRHPVLAVEAVHFCRSR